MTTEKQRILADKLGVDWKRMVFTWNRRFEFEWGIPDLMEFPPDIFDVRLTFHPL